MRTPIFSFLIVTLFFSVTASAQDSTLSSPFGIRVAASVSTKEVPLNRVLKFTVQVDWFGDLNRYEISEVENPVVRNFSIQSNASSSRSEQVGGQSKAIRSYEFELLPQELGMGYVEGLIVKYIDKVSGEGKHLITNRLEVKVIDPIPEPSSKVWLLWWIGGGIIIIALVLLSILQQQKKAEEKRRKAAEAAIVPIEEEYQQELKKSITLDSPDLDIKNAYSVISRIFRKYLAEKFNFGATNAITEEIINILNQNEVSESLINNTEEILNTCDVVKFSGGEGDKAGLERVYTLVEDFLSANLKSSDGNSEDIKKK